jgi:hypothetical protein
MGCSINSQIVPAITIIKPIPFVDCFFPIVSFQLLYRFRELILIHGFILSPNSNSLKAVSQHRRSRIHVGVLSSQTLLYLDLRFLAVFLQLLQSTSDGFEFQKDLIITFLLLFFFLQAEKGGHICCKGS